MSIVDHDGSAEFACGKDDVVVAIPQAVSRLPGMQVNRSERLSGRISVKTGVSPRSWGETVPISVTEIAPGRTRVSITSTPKTGVLFGGLFDLGKNRENIERIFSGAAEVLTGKPAHSSVPTPPPASWVYCDKCTGGNYPGAAYCQWCAAPLATRPASLPAEPIAASPQEVAPPVQDAGKKATPLATFGPSTGWVGKVITRQGDTFILEGHGPISAAAIMEYDRQGHLLWPFDGMRAWVASRSQTPVVVPAREARPTT